MTREREKQILLESLKHSNDQEILHLIVYAETSDTDEEKNKYLNQIADKLGI